jgi:hypothetical protein
MFVGAQGAYPRVENLKGYGLTQNITLGWKGLVWTNTLDYFEHL